MERGDRRPSVALPKDVPRPSEVQLPGVSSCGATPVMRLTGTTTRNASLVTTGTPGPVQIRGPSMTRATSRYSTSGSMSPSRNGTEKAWTRVVVLAGPVSNATTSPVSPRTRNASRVAAADRSASTPTMTPLTWP